MVIKKSGKTIYGAKLTAAEKKAMDMEIDRQMAEHLRRHTIEIEAIFIKRARDKLGWGEKQLRELFDTCDDDIARMIEHYELGEEDVAWLCTRQLKEEGFDIEKWYREKYPQD